MTGKRMGRPPVHEAGSMGRLELQLPLDVLEALRTASVDRGVSRSQVVEELVRRVLDVKPLRQPR
jgi:metal-responsive CopG/Arc/MetJ family transcriptional regulator